MSSFETAPEPGDEAADEFAADLSARLGIEEVPSLDEGNSEEFATEILLGTVFEALKEDRRKAEQAKEVRGLLEALGFSASGSVDAEVLSRLGYSDADKIT